MFYVKFRKATLRVPKCRKARKLPTSPQLEAPISLRQQPVAVMAYQMGNSKSKENINGYVYMVDT